MWNDYWLLLAIEVIPPYVIIGYSRLYYHRLFVVILLVVINVYSIVPIYYIGGYWFGDNFISGYITPLLVALLL